MDMDLAYANGAFIAGAEDYPPRWTAKAATFRAGLGARAQALTYGSGARQRFDLFIPEGEAKGCVTFIHGGYWMAFDHSIWSHLAAGVLARGWACAMPSYTLAPEARLTAMTAEMVQALAAISAHVPGPQVVTGHSAGGHLAARMGCADLAVPDVVRVVPISPLAELEPLRHTDMQATLRLDDAEIAAQSPARLDLRRNMQAHVWVGGQERPSFLWQARLLSEHWGCDWTVAAGRHHFDVIDALEDPASPLVEALVGGLG
ncbi:alpha/beta hydrolase [Pseudorhodobacter aquimaris]|uniref:alpha/beta hydrolase n=1 Tax=Pseudorhodobacter aquimaris TaxID=687412 RepID=UPI00067D21DB|nr:alpha/beta hydrolase [Pseudorhodobacter aquimaris]